MRYICHQNGCDLVFASVKEKVPTQLFKAMLAKHVFDLPHGAKVEKDVNQAIHVGAAQDYFRDIGEPEVNIHLILFYSLNIGSCNERESAV